ncbi:unnamed protein product [Schistosoma curassoni]|uniref:CTNNB1 binding N-teminal domain-containing protein n=1 Tax=Schistosoma curassoni TaxID=6186 RepID=A0A183JMH6_9TREM|nr:unnamed protein product [Schistosoma curassoni]
METDINVEDTDDELNSVVGENSLLSLCTHIYTLLYISSFITNFVY